MFRQVLYRSNHARCWTRSVRVAGLRVRACSADRLAYLWCHKLGLLGGDDRGALAAQLRPGMRAVDVGANLGLTTLMMARLVGPTGSVVALEPDPRLHAALMDNIAANDAGHVTALRVAAGDRAGRAKLRQSPLHTGDHRLYAAGEHDSRAALEVDVVRLDDLLALAGHAVDFVKIDVQGYEAHVLAGMEALMARSPGLCIMFEYTPAKLRAAGSDPEALLAGLRECGFVMYEVDQHGRGQRIEPGDAITGLRRPIGRYFVNLLAIRDTA